MFSMIRGYSNSSNDSVLSGLEVGSLLGSSDGLELGLGKRESSSSSLGSLGSEVFGGVLLSLPLGLGLSSSLLVENSENSGDGLSNNLKNIVSQSQEVFCTISSV